MEDNLELNNIKTNKYSFKYLLVFIGLISIILIYIYIFILIAPKRDSDVIIHVTQGQSIKDISNELYKKGVVKSPLFLQSVVAFFGSDQNMSIGDYKFEKGIWLPTVGYRLSRGIHNISPIKVTIPEGKTNIEIANIFANKINNFDKDAFLQRIDGEQGYLFPDTYFFYPLTTVEEIATILENTFIKKTNKLLTQGYKNYSKEDIVIMASIVQMEANSKDDANIIAGILWNRLQKGMLLQADAAPVTYKIKGLPESPITNSGLVAIEATVNPDINNYFFYLHDKSGMIHTAVTFAEHKKNIDRYLR